MKNHVHSWYTHLASLIGHVSHTCFSNLTGIGISPHSGIPGTPGTSMRIIGHCRRNVQTSESILANMSVSREDNRSPYVSRSLVAADASKTLLKGEIPFRRPSSGRKYRLSKVGSPSDQNIALLYVIPLTFPETVRQFWLEGRHLAHTRASGSAMKMLHKKNRPEA